MKIVLFIPCYVDVLYPEVGVATYRLLKSLGLNMEYPERQTCCGQPMGNGGFERIIKKWSCSDDRTIEDYMPATDEIRVRQSI